jgi:hypothetical protein
MRYEPIRREFFNHEARLIGRAIIAKPSDAFLRFQAEDGAIFDEDDLRDIADKLEELNGGM